MINVNKIQFKDNTDRYGHLTPIEGGRDIPFAIRRVYYISGVEEGVRRGFHSHRKLKQILICVHGKVKILVKTPEEEEVITLDSASQGLYIAEMVWREMYDFEDGAVLLVLASDHYSEDDYIRDYKQYEQEAKDFFGGRNCE